jgi:exopolysaccharide biosynthesis protein
MWFALFSAIIALNSQATASESSPISIEKMSSWKDLTPSPIWRQQDGIAFYQFKSENGSDANLVVMDLNSKSLSIRPFFNASKGTTSDAARQLNGLAAINGGYFNLSNGESASYVVIDGQGQCDPKQNRALVENQKLARYLPNIFNRSEVRFLKNSKGKIKAEISKHEDVLPRGWKLEHSVQAGPRLLPYITSKEEAFVRTDPDGKEVDAIGSNKSAARTAVGITADNHVLMLCVAGKGQDEFSAGISLPELASLLKRLGCKEAVNLDGGTSTTMVLSQDHNNYQKVCGGSPEKFVKSGLIIVRNTDREIPHL